MRKFYSHQVAGAVLLACSVFSGNVVKAQDVRTTLWVGTHLVGTDQYAENVGISLDLRISILLDELQLTPELESHLIQISAAIDPTITPAPALVRLHFNNAANKSLMVMSGVSNSGPLNLQSLVFVGSATPQFSVSQIQANLLSEETQPAARDFVTLFLIYSIMKEAMRLELDFDTYVRPLRDDALDLALSSEQADPRKVAAIRADLEALQP